MMRSSSVPSAWRYVAAGLALSAVAAFGIVDLASAHSRPDMPGPGGPVGPHAGFGGGMGMPHGPIPLGGPMLDRVLDELQASPAQREQLHQIAQVAQADLKAPGEAGRADHARMAELFAQPTIDVAAVETLRRQMLKRHGEVSKRVNVAMLDAAKVLTPEQRVQLGERMKQRAERRAAGRLGGADGDHPAPHDLPPTQR